MCSKVPFISNAIMKATGCAEQIIHIPLHKWTVDQLVWGANKLDMYSVKSGYHFAMEMVHRKGDVGTSHSHGHLVKFYPDFEISHVGRQGNDAAHILARYARSIEHTLQWWHSCPYVILNRVLVDGDM
ncbi:hypothetical protein I3842_14G096200 [Carya illinoinensis]|nr:hypothetical protein I3842_14G096200 [Carya illinoinensis]KAG6678755.1 hypothetical protein I3842_14G096200 [Carya illinoinensis]